MYLDCLLSALSAFSTLLTIAASSCFLDHVGTSILKISLVTICSLKHAGQLGCVLGLGTSALAGSVFYALTERQLQISEDCCHKHNLHGAPVHN